MTRADERIEFTERMAGSCAAVGGGPPGKLVLSLAASMTDPKELGPIAAPIAGTLMGTVDAEISGLGRLTIEHGTLVEFVPDPDVVDQAKMIYDVVARSSAGDRYRVVATKRLKDHRGLDLWRDSTTVDVTIGGLDGTSVARGTASIRPRDLMAMMASLRMTPSGRRRGLWRFGARFGAGIFGRYGRGLRSPADFADMASIPSTSIPSTSLPEPSTYWCDHTNAGPTWHADAVTARTFLRLRRYRRSDPGAPERGPVVITHGFAMNTEQFLLDMSHRGGQNLTQFLVDAGYDVWLFDYRAAIDLPSARTQFTLDDIARTDWPLAIAQVRAISGAPSVQVIAHCVGSLSVQMALLAGLGGVSHAITSQVSVNPRMHWGMRMKTRLRAPRLLLWLGFHAVDEELRRTPKTLLADQLVRLNPLLKGERCNSPLCRWAFFFFGPTHVHDQFDAVTHERLWQQHLFGVGSLTCLDHLARVVNRGHVVDADGEDTYRPGVHHLADTSITFLVGGRNRIFLPSGTAATRQWLAQHFDEATMANRFPRLDLGDYAHLDAFLGKRASVEVYPQLLSALERW